MKKFAVLLLAVLMLLTMTACGTDKAPEESSEVPSVAVIVAGTLGDRGFYDSSNEGRKKLEADLGATTTIIECKEDASRYEPDLITAAEDYNIVVAVGWQFWDALTAVAPEYPDVKFIFIDNGLDGVGDNLMSIIYKQSEGSFLVGYIAAKMSQTGKVGVVGGEDADTINDFIVGYEAGIAYANEHAGTQVEMLKRYANGYEDPANGKECANALYAEGCDIVFAVAGKTGEGVFEAAAEQGRYAIGVDSDQKFIDPEHIICSMIKSVDKSFYDVVTNMDAMFKGGTIWTADMANSYIDVAYGTDDMPQQVSDELKAEVNALKQQILSGEIKVPSTLN